MLLNALGTLTYTACGQTFAFPTQCTSQKIRIDPVYDRSQRTVIAKKYTLYVETVLVPGIDTRSNVGGYTPLFASNLTDVGPSIDTLKEILSSPGGQLVYKDTGFSGTLSINTTQVDVAYGPKPTVLAFEQITGTGAWRLSWTVETTIIDCNANFASGLLQFACALDWHIDQGGFTRRTITGYYQIGSVRARPGSKSIIDTADSYRERLVVPPVMGFDREQIYHEDDAKTGMTFSIIDREIPSPNPYFAGAIRCDVDMELESSMFSGGFQQWNVSLSGTIAVAPGYPKILAWVAFLILYKSKRDEAKNARLTETDEKGNKIREINGTSLMTRRFRIKDQVFGQNLSVSIQWLLFASPSSVFQASGFFKPVGTDWPSWHASLAQHQSKRGMAGMRSLVSDSTIIDNCPCEPNQAAAVNNNAQFQIPKAGQTAYFQDKCPDKDASWLWPYVSKQTFHKRVNLVTHQPLGQPESDQDNSTADDNQTVLTVGPYSDSSKPISYQRGGGRYYVRLFGTASRVCYEVNPPKLVASGNSSGKSLNVILRDKRITRATTPGTLVTRHVHWDIIYEVTDVPEGDLSVIPWDGGPPSKLGGPSTIGEGGVEV